MIQYAMFVHGCVFLKCYVIGISVGSAAHIQLPKSGVGSSKNDYLRFKTTARG